jgi:CRP-like cAMP-binding protein
MSDKAYRRRDLEAPPSGSLFDTTGMHRVPDRDTSVSAAKAVAPSRVTNRAVALDLLRKHPGGLTDFELADLSGLQQNSIGKRRGELVAQGLVRDSGLRRPSTTGSPAIVWEAT